MKKLLRFLMCEDEGFIIFISWATPVIIYWIDKNAYEAFISAMFFFSLNLLLIASLVYEESDKEKEIKRMLSYRRRVRGNVRRQYNDK